MERSNSGGAGDAPPQGPEVFVKGEDARYAALQTEVKHLQADMSEVKKLLSEMKSQQDKWRGGLASIVVISGTFGAFVAEGVRYLGK